jgi:cation transport protein ChaC
MRWIFGYGSLMWLPGFPHAERRPAVLKGYHRDYGMISTRFRGTSERPGLVVTLVPGGEVVGMAYRYQLQDEPPLLSYLDEREGADRAHKRVAVPVRLTDGGAERWLPAWTYLPILAGESYDVSLPLERKVRMLLQGAGPVGTSYDYLECLMGELHALGLHEPPLEQLWEAANRARAAQSARPAGAP